MPNKCCVVNCTSNYTTGEKRSAFRFPQDDMRRKSWISAIPRKNFVPTAHHKVCDLHFNKSDIIYEIAQRDSLTGQLYTATLKYPKLKETAIPSIFPNCPEYFNKHIFVRESRDIKLTKLEAEQLYRAIELSKEEFTTYKTNTEFKNYEEFLEIFKKFFNIPDGWFQITRNDKFCLIKVDDSPGPIITHSIVIDKKLNLSTFLYGEVIHIDLNGRNTPCVIKNINELTEILELINLEYRFGNNKSETNTNKILKHYSHTLRNIPNANDTILFISEQLELVTSSKTRYRYSINVMIIASILITISSHAYHFLRSSGLIILPHPSTVKSVCNKFLADPSIEERKSFLLYAKNIFPYLEEKEKHVILLLDEIHIQANFDYKGGNIVGAASNINEGAKSAFVFMISSVLSKFREVVHISPTNKINHQILYEHIKSVIVKLEEIGYKVFCVITDNNSINSRAMHNFSPKKSLSIVYPHPVDNTRPLFYIFDSVHLLKCIRNNWLNTKPDQLLHYPDFKTFSLKEASFKSLKVLYELEHDKLLKFGYSLTLKALHPTNIERQNVKLVLQVFNEYIIEALNKFGTNIPHSESTSNFLKTILTWWKIVNVKNPSKGKRLNDEYQEPITFTNSENSKLVFLNDMLNWLDAWRNIDSKQKLTNQTHTALSHTIHGLLEIIEYCRAELQMNYILLGKFQTDLLEERFGKYRQLSGGHYNISVRQLYEMRES